MPNLKCSKETATTLILVFSLVASLAVAGVMTAVLTSAASAQEVPRENATATPEPETGERIDNNTVLLDKSYNQDTGRVTLTIRSERLQEVTLTDAGAAFSGGELAQNSVTLRPDSVQEVTVEATEVDGFIGVTVATPSTLYGVPVETPGFRLNVPVENDVLALAVGVGLTPVYGYLWYRRAENSEQEGVLRI